MRVESEKNLKILRVWLLPFGMILLAFLVSFLFFMAIDYAGSETQEGFFGLFWNTEKAAASNILGSVAEVVAAILGIAITVVAIIVELAANRYTSRVTDLFVRDRVNFCVLGLFVVATMTCLWTGASIHGDFTPFVGVRWTLFLMSVSLLVLLPYFNYVFEFLQPANIINRIRQQVFVSLEKMEPDSSDRKIAHRKALVMTAAEQITDIALNSILQKDRGLAMGSTLVLRSMVIDTLDLKQKMPQSWYEISEHQRRNSDFVTLSEQGIQDLTVDNIWLEFKIFKQFNLIFAQSLNNLRDLNNLIAMCFRDIGISSDLAGDEGVRTLTVNFFNTIMRSTLNGKDVRTGYNVLHQYRQFCSHLIQVGNQELVLSIFKYLKYYGLLFDSRGMGFILETVAYDLYRLTREASDKKLPNEQQLLEEFLEVDRPPDLGSSDSHLRGVRKAQAMLAAYYIKRDKISNVRQIALDMSIEPSDRLASIRDEILNAQRTFWEITDRGVNFDYVEEELREPLKSFFDTYLPDAKSQKAVQ
jgi:hypothetical protein